jgi:sec-independent protein translocase protein TatA
LRTLLFFDFSGGEFLLIAVVFLMFFGSKSIPGMARTLGKAVRDFKEAANTVQREIHESASIEEVKEFKKPSPTESTIPQQATPPSTISQEANPVVTPPKVETTTPSEETSEKL